MAYTPTNWVNDSAPAINATNLNKIETGIDEAHDDLDAATEAATAGELIRRDGSGRAKVATPSATGDIANKGYVDGLSSNYATAAQGALADSAVQPSDAASTSAAGVVELATSGETTTGTDTTRAVTPSGLAATSVPKSLVDAKGDLLVGTADNTVGRLAVGTDGQIPYADSGEATGIRWDDAPSGGGGAALPTGTRLALTSPRDNSAASPPGGWMSHSPVWIPQDITITSLIMNLNGAGAGGSEADLAIYSTSGPGTVGTLLHSCGTIATDSTGVKIVSGTWAVPVGHYYFSFLNRGSFNTYKAGTLPGVALPVIPPTASRPGGYYISDNGAGSPPSTVAPGGALGADDQTAWYFGVVLG